jgi:hypothetical protein
MSSVIWYVPRKSCSWPGRARSENLGGSNVSSVDGHGFGVLTGSRPRLRLFAAMLLALTGIALFSAARASAAEETGTIAGHVTSAASEAGLTSIEVCATNVNGEESFEYLGEYFEGEYFSRCATSTSGGAYSITGLIPGAYRVKFATPLESTLNYRQQYYNNKALASEATSVTVSAATTTSAINAAMQPGGQVKGTVTDASSKAKLQGVLVCADERSGEYIQQCALTKASGEYTVPGLVTGEYTVEFALPEGTTLNYLPQYYNGAAAYSEATPVAVTAGSNTASINAALHAGGEIAGTVTDAATKATAANVPVCAYGAVDICAKTGSSGTYTIPGLPAGSYTVEFAPAYETTTVNYLAHETREVSVALGATTSGVNAALNAGAQIAGKVTGKGSVALKGIQVCAYYEGEEEVEFDDEDCTTTEASGGYTVSRLSTGPYRIEFSAPSNSATLNYLTQYYKGVSNYSEATLVNATEGSTISAINASMIEGGRVTGKVTSAASKAALADVLVCVLHESESPYKCTTTATNGEYRIGHLPTGTYAVSFAQRSEYYEYSATNRLYAAQYYNEKTQYSEAQQFSVTAAAVTGSINGALIEAGKIIGKITAAASKAALAEASVCAYSVSSEYYDEECTTTNSSGEYLLTGLPTGEYRLYFFDSGYVSQYYNNTTNYSEATAVATTNTHTTTGINAALELGAKITGTVTDAVTKAALPDVEVCAFVASGESVECTYTGTSGQYQLEDLRGGEYRIGFSPFVESDNYSPQFYNGKSTLAEAEFVSVATGATRSGINAGLQEEGKITGKVTNAASKAGVEGIEVCADGSTYRCTSTNAAGEYTVAGLPSGPYTVDFYSDGLNYISQYYNDKALASEATSVTVATATTTPNVNASLKEGGRISGTVTSAASKAALAAIEVCALPVSSGSSSCTSTNSSGEYSIVGLEAGEYKVEFYNNGSYALQYYNGKDAYSEAQSVSVTTGGSATAINAAMREAGQIAGTVTDAVSKAALSGITICAIPTAGGSDECASSNSSGEYTITGLQAGEYKVEFYRLESSYTTQYYNGKNTFAEAQSVSVVGGATTGAINAAMKEGGRITGTVTAASSKAALSSVEVCASSLAGEYSACGYTNSSGEYTIAGLLAGEYKVVFFGNGSSYATQYYNGKTQFSEAQTVTVTTGGTTGAINAVMGLAGSISGTVTDSATHGALQGITVCARTRGGEYADACALTSSTGTYTISGLTPGEFVVEFSPGSGATANYAPQYYNAKATFAEAAPVAVSSGATVGNINAALVEGGRISGKITDAVTKAALAGVNVCASEALNEIGSRCTTTNSSGEYAISSLAPGRYRVRYSSASGEYATQYYEGASTFSGAQVIAVANGVTVEGLNAALLGGGKISGVVTSAASKAAIAGIDVCAGEACATTNASGEYTLIGLGAGEYVVSFRGDGLNYQPQFYKEKSNPAEATKVSVAVHTTTPSINASMLTGGEIAGTVTNAASKAAVAGVSVCASPHSGGADSECATTNASGEYVIAGLPANSYTVAFGAGPQNFVVQYYNNKAVASEAEAVPVTVGARTPSINAALREGGRVSGTVTRAANKAPIGHVSVCASKRGGGASECALTNLAGEYTIPGLPAGEYTVGFDGSSSGYVLQYYNGKSSSGEASVVTVSAGTTTGAVNAALEEGGKISGTVIEAGSHADVPGLEVYVYKASGGAQVTSAVTKRTGEYVAEGLPAGEYKVEFFSTSNTYETQYYNGKATLEKATPVAVTAAGHVTPNINAELSIAGSPAPPKITGLAPNRGTELGGTSVTITGTNLTGASVVSFGGVAAKSFTVEGSVIKASAPAGKATVDVRVTTASGLSAITEADRYRYLTPEEVELAEAATEAGEGKPTVTAVSPSSVLQTGGTVTITGSNYVGVKAVTFGEVAAESFEVISPTKISAHVPAVKIRDCNASVETGSGSSKTRTLSELECVPAGAAPAIAKLSPNKGPAGGGTKVTLTGTALAGITQVSVGGLRATQVDVVSETSITFVVPAHAEGIADISVVTANGTSPETSKDHFKYKKPATPTVNFLSALSGPLGGGNELTVGGTDFASEMSFLFGKTSVKGTGCISTSCKVTVPAASKAGQIDVIAVDGKSKSKKSSEDRYTYE